jgi:hypothetical protein
MKLKKIAAALLGAVLTITLFAGCASAPKPGTVMMTVDGKDIAWDELLYLIHYNISNFESQGGEITDWSADYSEGVTYQDYILEAAVDNVLQDAAIDYGAGQMGVTLSDEAQAAIQSDWDSQVASAGSEEAFIDQLEQQHCTKELYLKFAGVSQLAQACFTEMYGENGDKLTDEEIADYTAEDGYMMVKHILLMTVVTDDSGTETPMTDDEKAQVREKMEEILTQLKNYTGDDFDAYFDELMVANSEDPGVNSFPDGYLFTGTDSMYPEFLEAAKALEIGQFSDVVESQKGYHILYKIPLNYDITPMAYSSYGTFSLRYITAVSMFNSTQDVWIGILDVTYSKAYSALNFENLIPLGK